MADAGIPKMNLESKDLVGDRLAKLRELMPECFSESGIDFEKLRLELGDEVDEGQERYAFTWPGKMDAIRQSQTKSTATLRPCVEKSRGRDGQDGSFDSDNIYIEGDNLEVLKLLQRGYAGKVKMIYIDPPYNTGHDFVYKDKFDDTIANYKEQAGLADQSNAETSGRYHSDWCSMMYPRLRLARELLREDGLLFASIDDNELYNLKRLTDEAFGEANYVATFIWEKRKTRENRKAVSIRHDYIICYAKNADCLSEALGLEPMNDEALARYKNPDNDPRGPWTSVPAIAQGGHGTSNQFYTFVSPAGNAFNPPSGSCWRMTEAKMREAIADNRIWFGADGNNVPRIKKFLNEGKQGLTPESMLAADLVGTNDSAKRELVSLFEGHAVFETPKPTSLLKHLISIVENGSDGIYCDFFSGTATFADAVFEMNLLDGGTRKWLLVQIPEISPDHSVAANMGYKTICSVAEERIRRAGDKIKAEAAEANAQPKLGEEPKGLPDIGFRAFTLDDSGIQRPDPGVLLNDVVKPDRSDLDIVFEMMLKWGLELTLTIEREEFAGYPAYSVAAGELICCLAPGLTTDTLEAIADECPRRVFILDSVLTDSLKLNALQLFRAAGERHGEEIDLRTV